MTKARIKTRETGRKNDGVYFRSLNALIDELFSFAAKNKWTWDEMANQSGLSSTTIHNLGNNITKYPQYRTVELLAYAFGGRLTFKAGKLATTIKMSGRSWKPSDFNKKVKAA